MFYTLVQRLVIHYIAAGRNTTAECYLLHSDSTILLQNPGC